MQQMTQKIAASATTPSTSAPAADTTGEHQGDNTYVPQRTLTDIRDSKTYQVKKLADGNVWMTQNLALVGPFYPDKSDSDVTWDKVTSGVNETFELPALYNGYWCSDQTAECIDQPLIDIYSDASYGIFYNFFAATAGTGSTSLYNQTAPNSVCPKGWRLPTGTSTVGEFSKLYSYYNTFDKLVNGAPSFLTSGRRIQNVFQHQGTHGFYWSGSGGTIYTANNLYLKGDTSSVYPSDAPSRYYGNPLRCIAK
jgi:uncharacterized protein (TIGR02145 family)